MCIVLVIDMLYTTRTTQVHNEHKTMSNLVDQDNGEEKKCQVKNH